MSNRDWSQMTLAEMTWGERLQAILVWVMLLVVTGAGVCGALLVLGRMDDVANERRAEYTRCMKHATNGYDIERCR